MTRPISPPALRHEYDVIGKQEFGLSDAELTEITRTAIKAAFVDEDTRAMLAGKGHLNGFSCDSIRVFGMRALPSRMRGA